MGSTGEVAAGVADGCSPREQDGEQLVEVVAECVECGSALGVGGPFYVLAEVTTGVAEAVAIEQTTGAESVLGRVELVVGARPGADVGAHGEAPIELREQADLGGVDLDCGPGGGVRVAAVLAELIGETPHIRQRGPGQAE